MSEKSSKHAENERVVFMNCTAEASHLLRRAAEPRPADDSIKAAIVRAARRAGIGYERAKSIWYGEARRIDAHEMDRLRAVAAERQAKREEAARNEWNELADRIAAIEARLASIDEDFYRPARAALRASMGAPVGAGRDGDRTVDGD